MMIAAGVLLYVLLVGRYPFYDQTAESLFKKIRKGEYTIPSRLDLSLDVRIIIHSLLRMDPSKRLATDSHSHNTAVHRRCVCCAPIGHNWAPSKR